MKNEALEKRNPSEALAKKDKRIGFKIILLILLIAGFFDSTYLTILHYGNITPPCSIAKGCEIVLTSRFSTIYGIPVALLGSLFFLTLIFLLLLRNQKNGVFNYFKLLTLLGVIASAVFFYIQAFILHAFCQYCLLSEIIILAIFILSKLDKKRGIKCGC